MSPDPRNNLAASVRQRLQNLARARKEDFQLVLGRFALERLLYRLSQSPHSALFVLKGAILFQLWTDQPHRPTRDIDFLGSGDSSVARLQSIFSDVCQQPTEDDGLIFVAASVAGELIKPDQEYEGVRITLLAQLERARIPIQIDVGFGDAITPGPESIQFPSLLGFPTPLVASYPKETVVAEKLQAAVMLGMANTRMKDFYDLWVLTQQFEFSGELLCRAVQATFARRRTEIPVSLPLALTAEFTQDKAKQSQWQAFLKRGRLASDLSLEQVIGVLSEFLGPVLQAARTAEPRSDHWKARGPWEP